MPIVTATQLKNGLGSFLKLASSGEVIVITKNGREICELRPRTDSKLALFDSLTGIAEGVAAEQIRDERSSAL